MKHSFISLFPRLVLGTARLPLPPRENLALVFRFALLCSLRLLLVVV